MPLSAPSPGNGSGLLAGTDRALVLACLADRLRRAGVPVPLAATARAAAAVVALDDDGDGGRRGLGPADLYWATRVSLVSDRSELATFDAVFAAVFGAGDGPVAPGRRERPPASGPLGGDRLRPLPGPDHAPAGDSGGLPWVTRPRSATLGEDDSPDGDDAAALPELLASAAAVPADRPFDRLDLAELAAVCRLVERWAVARPTRPGRRHGPATTGRVELRGTLRRAGRTGGDPVELGRHRPRRRPRRLALLLDVSGSMETFARVYLHLARALVAGGDTEVFALSTGATRLTGPLGSRSSDDAVERATALVGDRFGGTRLATSIGAVIGHNTWSGAVRGGVVVVVSDGWDTDPPESLARRMARLSRLADRVVWVNPRAAAEDYRPLVGGMAAALPHCDRFLSGHSLAALAEVLDAIAAP